jgi:lambda repressor-like predicted transcriptional regulator
MAKNTIPRKKWVLNDIKDLLEKKKQGCSLRNMAYYFGVSANAVRKALKRYCTWYKDDYVPEVPIYQRVYNDPSLQQICLHTLKKIKPSNRTTGDFLLHLAEINKRRRESCLPRIYLK